MTALSSALAAMNKSPLGEFERYLYQHDVAKPALGFIKEALPWIKHRAEILTTLLILARAEKDKEAYAELIADASEELAALDALIARTKPEEVDHAEH